MVRKFIYVQYVEKQLVAEEAACGRKLIYVEMPPGAGSLYMLRNSPVKILYIQHVEKHIGAGFKLIYGEKQPGAGSLCT